LHHAFIVVGEGGAEVINDMYILMNETVVTCLAGLVEGIEVLDAFLAIVHC